MCMCVCVYNDEEEPLQPWLVATKDLPPDTDGYVLDVTPLRQADGLQWQKREPLFSSLVTSSLTHTRWGDWIDIRGRQGEAKKLDNIQVTSHERKSQANIEMITIKHKQMQCQEYDHILKR